ncbi:MAG: class II glutamine amidotransferase, partial [Acidimicrobiia bacterium]|nr:class II glutamine amidotransferase [Acidimicrobiia bacterium]
RIMAHNGGFEQIELVEAELGPDLARVHGDTDSERFFALITKRIAEHEGDVSAGVADAVRWLAENVPLYSLNLVLATENQLWALRYPEHHHLYVLRRPLIDPHGRTFRAVSPTMRVAATELGMGETVVVASEPMDEKSDWRLMDPGELMHVSADLEVDSQIVISEPPALRSVDPLPYVP